MLPKAPNAVVLFVLRSGVRLVHSAETWNEMNATRDRFDAGKNNVSRLEDVRFP